MRIKGGRYAPVLSATEAQPRTKTLGKGSASSEEHASIMVVGHPKIKLLRCNRYPHYLPITNQRIFDLVARLNVLRREARRRAWRGVAKTTRR